MATVAAVIASTHSPLLLPARAPRRGADRPPFASTNGSDHAGDRGVPPDPHPGRARRPGHGGQRPLPPAVAGTTMPDIVPGGQGAVLRRRTGTTAGTRVRPAAGCCSRARRAAGRLLRCCARAWTCRLSTWPSATSLSRSSTTAVTCPIITLRPQADLPVVPVYTEHGRFPRRRCPGRNGSSSWAGPSGRWSSPGRRTSGWPSSAPGTCRWSSAARASSARTAPTRNSTAGRWPGSPTATSTAA